MIWKFFISANPFLFQKETISKRHQIISKLTQQDGIAMKMVNLVLNKYRNSFKHPKPKIVNLSTFCCLEGNGNLGAGGSYQFLLVSKA